MWRRKLVQCAIGCLTCCLAAGCVQQMANQPRYEPLEASRVFPDGLSSRTPVPGTVVRGQLRLDPAFYTGQVDGQWVTELPAKATSGHSLRELLNRGRERFTVFCSHCHGQIGGGTGGDPKYVQAVGMVVQRGFPSPPTYHQPRLRERRSVISLTSSHLESVGCRRTTI